MDNKRIASELLRVAKALVAGPKFKEGDLVRFKGKRRVYKVERVTQWDTYDLRATTGGMVGSRPTNVMEDDLEAADAPRGMVTDKSGMTAYDAAKKMYPVGSKVVVGMHRLLRDQLGKVMKISPKGRITVQTFVGGKYDGQEDFVPDMKKKGEKIMFTPDVFQGEWTWGSRSNYIKGPYKGGKITSLLD